MRNRDEKSKNTDAWKKEDMCQLTERLAEDKYRGSYEQIAKAIQKYSANPGLDVINFFEILLFSFLTGNADMHLKNFSQVRQPGLGMVLSAAYDLVATVLVNPADDEDLGLTLNGERKKSKGRISLLLSIPRDWMRSNRKTSLRRWKKANPHG